MSCVAGIGTPCSTTFKFPVDFGLGVTMRAVCSSTNGARLFSEGGLGFGDYSVSTTGGEVQRSQVFAPLGGENTELNGYSIMGMVRHNQSAPNTALQTTHTCFFSFSVIDHRLYD
jgi:hypothetical protein